MVDYRRGAALTMQAVDDQGNALPVSTTPAAGSVQDVNLKNAGGAAVAQGHGTAAAALRVELPTDGNGVVGLNAGSQLIGKVGIDQTTPGTTNLVAVAGSSGAIASTNLLAGGDGQSLSAQALFCAAVVGLFNGSAQQASRLRDAVGAIGSGGTGSVSVEEDGRAKANITTAATTTVKSGAGVLRSITFNTQVASATVTIYDNTSASGTKIGTITLPSTVGIPFTLQYDVAFGTGLTIVTSAATDITVAYR